MNCEPCKHCQHYVYEMEGDGRNEPFFWWMECEVDSEVLDFDCRVTRRCPHFVGRLPSDDLKEDLANEWEENVWKEMKESRSDEE